MHLGVGRQTHRRRHVLTTSLVKSLKTNPNPQSQYWAISSLWQLSFERVAAEGLDKWAIGLDPGRQC